MKKAILSSLFILFAVLAVNAQQVKIVFTKSEYNADTVYWNGKSTLVLRAVYKFRNEGAKSITLKENNFQLPCECSKIEIPLTTIPNDGKEYQVTYVYTYFDETEENKEKKWGEHQKVEKARGKVNKKIGFYIDGMEEAKKLFFKAVILKK
jgi:hypothetical protein